MAAILLSGCGNAPVAESQPEEQTVIEQAAVVENISTQSEAELKETEAIFSPRANLTYPIVDTDQGNC